MFSPRKSKTDYPEPALRFIQVYRFFQPRSTSHKWYKIWVFKKFHLFTFNYDRSWSYLSHWGTWNLHYFKSILNVISLNCSYRPMILFFEEKMIRISNPSYLAPEQMLYFMKLQNKILQNIKKRITATFSCRANIDYKITRHR